MHLVDKRGIRYPDKALDAHWGHLKPILAISVIRCPTRASDDLGGGIKASSRGPLEAKMRHPQEASRRHPVASIMPRFILFFSKWAHMRLCLVFFVFVTFSIQSSVLFSCFFDDESPK